jgi:hypothetical protein
MLTSDHKLCTLLMQEHHSLMADGLLVASQNLASSEPAAKFLIGTLRKMAK